MLRIISHPTTDLEEIDPAVLAAVAADVRRLISEGKTVVIMDSGGWTRTGAVAACLGAASMTVSSLGLDAELARVPRRYERHPDY